MRFFWLYLILLASAIFAINWLAKKEYINKQIARKMTHIVIGIVACTFPLLLKPLHIMILCAGFIALMGISKLNKILVLNTVDRVTWGEVYFPAGVGICAFISLPQNMNAYFVGILCLTFADTVANIVGSKMPMRVIKIGTQTKSIGGLLACATMVFIIFSIFVPITPHSWLLILAISIFLGLTEVLSIYGIDNFTLPVAATLIYLLINN